MFDIIIFYFKEYMLPRNKKTNHLLNTLENKKTDYILDLLEKGANYYIFE
jgi:hypothetical protein